MKLIRRITLPLLLLALIVPQTGCGGTSQYTNLAKGLYSVSIGLDKLEKWNEAAYRSGDIDKTGAGKINDGIIKATQLKKRANELFSKVDPSNPAPADVDAVLGVVDECATIVTEMQQAGELGIKNPDSQKTFGLIVTGIVGGIAIAKAVRTVKK